jgi:hypothetical protein
MLLTVFTPSYNRAQYLPRLYASLKAQTDKDFEFVLVDDGSATTPRRCSRAVQGGMRLRVQVPPQGKTWDCTRPSTPDCAWREGELFLFVGSDSWLDPDAVAGSGRSGTYPSG